MTKGYELEMGPKLNNTNMNKDLILEAVKAFPVWPESGLIVKPVKGTKLFVEATIEKGNTVSFWLNGKLTNSDIDSIDVINREDHIRCRVELFRDAPEDAEFCSPQREGYYNAWWKKVHNTYFIVCPDNQTNEWERSGTCHRYDFIPRPTPEELAYIAEIELFAHDYGSNIVCENHRLGDTDINLDNEVILEVKEFSKSDKCEFVPEVGQECEYSFDGIEYSKCIVMGYFDDLVWINHHYYDEDGLFSGSQQTHVTGNLSFRPLKTEAEKEREELYVKAITAIRNDMLNYLGQPYDYRDAVEALLDADMIKRPSK